MIKETIKLMEYMDADDPSKRRLVRVPVSVRGTYVEVEDYSTGERFIAHVADLHQPK